MTFVAIILVVVFALATRSVYLATAESAFNAEEAPITAVDVLTRNPHSTNIGATRLYGTGNFTTAVSIYALGFQPLALKLPNLVFFLATLVFLALLSHRLFAQREGLLFIVPPLLLALGPPVAQIWGLKNRGGFIETMFALVFLLWMMARNQGYLKANSAQFLFFAIVIGIATYSQPIALIYGLVLLFFVNLRVYREAPADAAAALAWSGFGLFVGLLPLIVLNFYFNFNTIAIIGLGEAPAGIGELGMKGRAMELLQGGIPRLLGLKEQWGRGWLLPAPVSLAVYLALVAPFLFGVFVTVRSFFRTRNADTWLAVLCVFLAIVAANIVSSWGNFQLEPRRLLLLYIPFVLLTARGLAKSRWLAIAYCAFWIAFSAWANVSYVKKHPDGFSHRVYRPLNDLADFLLDNGITGVYTDVWVGNRLTFASEGKIAWFRTRYMPTSYGFKSDGTVGASDAVLFDSKRLGRDKAESFESDLERSRVRCRHEARDGFDLYFACSRTFEIDGLNTPTEFSTNLLDPRSPVLSQVGVKTLKGIETNGEAGYLIFGPYYRFGRGVYEVEVFGDSESAGGAYVDVVSRRGTMLHFKRGISTAPDPAGSLISGCFELESEVEDLEVRVFVNRQSRLSVEGYRLGLAANIGNCPE